MSELSIEQKIIMYLAQTKVLTRPYVIDEAMNNPQFAETIITGNGLKDEIEVEGMGTCEHESLSNEEIQEVFDNDEN